MNISQSNTTALRSDVAGDTDRSAPHNATHHPERAMGTGYGRSSGYASRDSYSGSRSYATNKAAARFRFS